VQIYILDTVEQLNVRRANNNNLDPVVMDNLQTMLLDSHPYIGQYRHAYELIKEKPADKQQEVKIRLHVNLQQDQRTHNLPTAEEIAVIIPEEGVHHAMDNRDVVLRARGGQLEWISQNSPSYAALHYVLLRERIGGIQEFQSIVLNLENKGRMQDKEMKRNRLTHRWFLINATMYQRAKLCARIKLTAFCSAFDKENSIEFLLDLLHYIYTITIMAMHLVSYSPHVTC